jgi:hypothetical protein
MFLSAAELCELTGYRTGKRQCLWLARNGYTFDVRGDGRPALSRAQYERRHSDTPKAPRPSALKLDALARMR